MEPLTADSLRLRKKNSKRPAYGKFKSGVLISDLLVTAISALIFAMELQKVLIIQLLLNTRELREDDF